MITLPKNVLIQIFLRTFPVCVPNTGDNDVIYLTRAESYHRKLRKLHIANAWN